METIIYKKHTIEINHDEMAENPFKNWDGLLPLISKSGRFSDITDYSENGINSYLSDVLTDGQIIRHQKKLAEIFGGFIYDAECTEDKISQIREMIQESTDFDELEQICKIAKVPYTNTTVRGYSQGDWADVFSCYTSDFERVTGIEKKDVTDKSLSSNVKLFSDWAFNDVYGFFITEIDDSCCGFYGTDHEQSGLLEMAKESIDSSIKHVRSEKFNKLKELIKSKVPIFYRSEILEQFNLI